MSIELDKLPSGFKRIWRDDDSKVGDMLCIELECGVLLRIDALSLSENSAGGISIMTHRSDEYEHGYDEGARASVTFGPESPVDFREFDSRNHS